jgi:hypothetical protein
MGSPVLPRLVLLPFFIVWTTGAVGAASIGLAATGTVQAAEAPGFGPKLQVGGSAAIVLLVPLFSYLSFTTSLEAFGVLPSDTSGGFLYRGFSGLALGVSLESLFPVARSRRDGTLSLGVTGGASAALPAYAGTTLYFFYPEIRTGVVMSWQLAAPKSITLRVGVPVRFQLRRDLTFSGSTGLAFDVFYYLGGPP